MKNLENYGVLEMNANEIKEIDGGWLAVVVGLIAKGVCDSIEHPKAFLDGLLKR